MTVETKAYLGLMGVAFFWGTSFAASKIALKDLPPMYLAILRFSIASIIFYALLGKYYRDYKIQRKDKPLLWFLGVLGISSYFYIQYTGLNLTTTVNTAIIIATNPIFTALLSSLLFHQERLSSNKLLGILLGFTGIFLIFAGGTRVSLGGATIKGDLLILCNSVAWAFFTVMGKSLVDSYDPFVVIAHINIYGTATMLPLAFSRSFIYSLMNAGLETWLAALYLALTCSVFAYYMWYRGVRILGASRTAAFNYLNPLFAVTIGILFLKESWNLFTLVGGAAILLGVYVASLKGGQVVFIKNKN
ncbi:DMT family transporter [Thermosediminibacter litoriperuensis]|uniref:Drug/metabolite transporter (DMT)-like permease n=1 Tax=Thermosediminibacter litoriperuensis TaxID=291989 RepID=A0A5S5AUN2_9FIRM|nr:DMT family transporter [Thermosediminibacter litoriperuensis]TYP56151.1 drug/metabolite transporter (DMT)-like permease [Thermosediminibacter litoriperuensis]